MLAFFHRNNRSWRLSKRSLRMIDLKGFVIDKAGNPECNKLCIISWFEKWPRDEFPSGEKVRCNH